MKKGWLALLFLVGLLIVACREEVTPSKTPGPVPTIGRPPFGAAPVSALSLLRNPADFQGLDLELSGDYKPLPLLVCAEDRHISPATWAITEGQIEILAGGFDQPLRELLDPGTNLVVQGRWQLWEGPVGCGRRAPAEKIWYLAVSDIISPNPLVSGGAIAQLPESEPGLQETPGPLGSATGEPVVTLTPVPTQGGELTPGVTTATSATSASFTPPPTPTEVTAVSRTPSRTPTASTTPTPSRTLTPSGQATATGTGTPTVPATLTSPPTATSANTATATTVSGEYTPIGYEDLVKRMISANESHTYRFVADNGDTINVAAAPTAGLDISIELIGPNGSILQTRNAASAGQPESLGPYNLTSGGVHQVKIKAGSNNGHYAVVVQTLDALPYIVFQGNINYGDTVSGGTPVDRDDMWNFMGSAGDSITIETSATTSTDLIVYVNGPDTIELDFADEDLTVGPPGDQEIIELTLTEDGLYTIGVGEIDFNPIGYTLTLTRN